MNNIIKKRETLELRNNYDYYNTKRIKKMALLRYTCLRCGSARGNTWTPRVQDPKQCPKGKSPYWNKPRKKEVKKE
jgi:hypothetical protein